MTTYTIAIIGDMLIATVADGDDIATAVRDAIDECRGDPPITEYDIISGLTLTDEFPENPDTVVWNARGGHGGFLMVETSEGTITYNYAVSGGAK